MKTIKTIIICVIVTLIAILLTGCDLRNKDRTARKAWSDDPATSIIEEAYETEVDTLYRQDFLVHFVIDMPQEKIYGLYNPMSNQFFNASEPFTVKIVDPFLFVSDNGGQKWLPMTNDGFWVSHDVVERAYIINPRQRDYSVLTYTYQTWELRMFDKGGTLRKCAAVPQALISAAEKLEACDTLSFAL